MSTTKILLSLFVINTLACPLMAEEENADTMKKITIKTVMTFSGFVAGLMTGALFGCSAIQNKDSLPVSGAKVLIPTIIGATCGTIGGKNVADKYIAYYYPEQLAPKTEAKPSLLTKENAD